MIDISSLLTVLYSQVFVLAQSEMELPFPLEMGKNEMDGSDDDGMSYQTSRG